jgi:hypothetical protein
MENPKEVEMSNLWVMFPWGVFKDMNVDGFVMRGEWPARWEPQEEGVMSIVARFPSVRNQGLSFRRKETMTTEGDAC